MLEILAEYGLFLAKVVTVALALAFVFGSVFSASSRPRDAAHGKVKVTNLNETYRDMREAVRATILPEAAFKLEQKQREKDDKQRGKKEKKAAKKASSSAEDASDRKQNIYVLDFDGDMAASAVANLRQEITAVLSTATDQDEVVVRLESPGGMVHSYGLAASQLYRLKSAKLPLTICVDKVAASGGYMMACLADKIVAAPFAIVGSIGVVAQVPNFNRILKKNDIDVEVLTAGEYKRTLTMLGENTEKGRAKFIEDLEETHSLFKQWVGEHRPQLDIDSVSTGETWYGSRAVDNSLVDEIATSDDYLYGKIDSAELFQVRFEKQKTLQERLGMAASDSVDTLLLRWWQRASSRWFS